MHEYHYKWCSDLRGIRISEGLLYSVAWQPNFDKHTSRQERGGGVRATVQLIWMATEYKIVVVPDSRREYWTIY